MADIYNAQGDLLCNEGKGHEFSGGLCVLCLCPESERQTQRAINAFYNYEELKNRYSEVLKRFVTKEDAIFQAWSVHRERE
jgi:hypothetical protein